jgi:hypothetical protein
MDTAFHLQKVSNFNPIKLIDNQDTQLDGYRLPSAKVSNFNPIKLIDNQDTQLDGYRLPSAKSIKF